MRLSSKLFLAFIPLILTLAALGIFSLMTMSRIAEEVENQTTRDAKFRRMAQTALVDLETLEGALRTLDAESPRALTEAGSGAALDRLNDYYLTGGSARLDPDTRSAFKVLIELLSGLFGESADPVSFAETRARALDALVRVRSGLEPFIREEGAPSPLAADLETLVKRTSDVFILAIAAAVLLTGYLTHVLNRHIVRPISTLTEATRQLSSGQLESEILTTRRDEIGGLARHFNRMARTLQKQARVRETISDLRKENLESLLRNIPHPAFVVSGQASIIFSNRLADELPLAELLEPPSQPNGHSSEASLHQDLAASIRENIPVGYYHVSEALLVRVRGHERHYLPQIIPVTTSEESAPSGIGDGAIVLLQDVSLLHLAYRLKTNSLATVSHELKTPLTSLRLALRLLRDPRSGELNERQKRLLESSDKDTQRLLEIIHDILAFSRVDDAAQSLQRKAVSLRAIVDQIQAGINRTLVPDKPMLVEENRLPDAKVLVDAEAFGGALSQLAIHTISGSDPQPVHIAVRALEDAVEFRLTSSTPPTPDDPQEAWTTADPGYRMPLGDHTDIATEVAREILEAHGAKFQRIVEENRSAYVVVMPA